MVFDTVDFDCCFSVNHIGCLFHVGVGVRDGSGMALYVSINDLHELRSIYTGSNQTIVLGSAMVGRAIRGDIFEAQDVVCSENLIRG